MRRIRQPFTEVVVSVTANVLSGVVRPIPLITYRAGNTCALMSVVAMLIVSPGWSLDPQKAITQFQHQSWRAADGIGSVFEIAQTADGYLWLSTSNGVYRFDGMRFDRLQAELGELTNAGMAAVRMLGSRDGALWLACGPNLVRWQDGQQRTHRAQDGLPGGLILAIHETPDGAIWAGTEMGLSRYADGEWKQYGADDGLPGGRVRTLFRDREENLWTGVELPGPDARHVFFMLPRGATGFRLVGDTGLRPYKAAQAPDGKIWVAQLSRSVRGFIPKPVGVDFESPEIRVGSRDIHIDRDGGLWITTVGDGLRRVRDTRTIGPADIGQHGDEIDKFTQKDGLSNDYVVCVFEGREGEIWVGTSSGLDCFRESKFTAISTREGLPANPMVLQPAADGKILAGSSPRGFTWIEEAGRRFVDLQWSPVAETAAFKRPENPETVTCLVTDPRGGLLAGAGVGLISISMDGREFSLVPGTENLSRIEALTRDASGTLWISDHEKGLWRFSGDRLEKVPDALRAMDQCAPAAHTDQRGRVWFAVSERRGVAGHLLCYEQGEFRRYLPQDAHFPNIVFSIFSDANGQVWFAGQGGLSRFVDGRFQTLTRRHGLPDDVLFAVLEDNDGYFWLSGATGIFRASVRELENALAAESDRVTGELFSIDDGLRGFVQSFAGFGGSVIPVKESNGRLWFPTSVGVATIHPQQIRRNPLAPPVHIQRVVAAGTDYSVSGPLVFPVGTRDCEIDYVGICFSNPQKVRYRYRLQGHDVQWVEAGSRRQAFYSNLRPGEYKFQVIASNNDGVWNEAGAAVEFSVPPAFYETRWFAAASLLPVAFALWGVHRFRLARLAARMNLQLESQTVERRRIARELHDTILQGFIGVSLKLDAIATSLPESVAPMREQLRRILDQSDHYLAEARRSVSELRSPSLEKGADFSQALARASERLVEGTGIQLDYAIEGKRRKLAPHVENNLLRVGEEAVSNAVRHAQPTRVEVNLAFGPKEIRLRVRDNGSGFDFAGPATAKAGHFGLVGMHERAEAMGGHIVLVSQSGKGSEVIVTVPVS